MRGLNMKRAVKRVYSRLGLGVFVMVVVACGLAAQEESKRQESANNIGHSSSTAEAESPYVIRIASGDLLEIAVYGIPELKQQVRVSAAGVISLPLIGPLSVAGFSSLEAEMAIARQLRDGKFLNDPHVSVFIKEYATQGISVLGEVEKPGIYPLLGSRRLFDAISAAGGLSERAGKEITLIHRNQPEKPVKITMARDPLEAVQSNLEVYPGDTIVVAKAGVVYVVGDVNRPSGFLMDKNDSMTVLQAIALAEGTKGTAALNSARLIRRTTEGQLEIPIALKTILAGKSPDVTLQAEDILFVPGSLGKGAARRSMEAIIQIATGVAIFRR